MPIPINPTWQQATWFIDPANSSGLADDANSGIDSAHPVLTWASIVAKWGTQQPRLRQDTTFTFMSSQADNSDPIYFDAYVENGARINFVGVLGAAQTIVSGVLAGVVAKNRATPQLLNATLGAGVAVGSLVVNTTHNSRAWVYANVAGNTWAMSQPLVPAVLPTPSVVPAEVDTWANGDSYTAYNPVSVRFDYIGGRITSSSSGSIVVNSLTLAAVPSANSFDEARIDSTQTILSECKILREQLWRTVEVPGNSGIVNCALAGTSAIQKGLPGTAGTLFFTGGFTLANMQLASVNYTGDVILNSAVDLVTNGYAGGYGTVYVETGRTVRVLGAGDLNQFTQYGGPIVWGPGVWNVGSTVRNRYPAGAGLAVATFLNTGGLNLNGQGTAYSVSTGAAAVWSSLALTPAALDAAQGVAGFGGLAMNPGGATITNLSI